jgi:hypothetical protein
MLPRRTDWDFNGAAASLKRALQLNPSHAESRRAYAWYLHLVGRSIDAIAEMKRAVALEPLTPIFHADLA